jgi:hypothetical protein
MSEPVSNLIRNLREMGVPEHAIEVLCVQMDEHSPGGGFSKHEADALGMSLPDYWVMLCDVMDNVEARDARQG